MSVVDFTLAGGFTAIGLVLAWIGRILSHAFSATVRNYTEQIESLNTENDRLREVMSSEQHRCTEAIDILRRQIAELYREVSGLTRRLADLGASETP